MDVLVTGDVGQIGWWTRAIASPEKSVIGLDRRGQISIDVRSSAAKKLAARSQAVIHLAALIDVAASIEDPAATLETNVAGTQSLLNAVPDDCHFVFVSSAAVYGEPSAVPISETHPLRPLSPYGDSKLQGEALVKKWGEKTGGTWTIIRPFNVYSSRQDPSNSYSGVVSKFLAAAKGSREIEIFGDGSQTRDFVHAFDLARLLWLAVDSPQSQGLTFNGGTGSGSRIDELAAQICTAIGGSPPIRYSSARVGDIHTSISDPQLASAVLGWRAEISLQKGVQEMLHGPKIVMSPGRAE